MKDKINELKSKKNALILAHNYQRVEIRDVADHIGDSLELARIAESTDKDYIVFCGVRFMAETAKILNPERTVLLPSYDAGCPMADMVKVADIENLKKQNPNAAVACYVNTTAGVKAASDVCVTSANSVKVIDTLDEDEIIFVPDMNLAKYVARQTPKKIIPFSGYCNVHHRFNAQDVLDARVSLPGSYVIVHPECRPEVTEIADVVCSTSQMLKYAENSSSNNIIIGTEAGMIEILEKAMPNKGFYSLGNAKVCPNMKKTTMKRLYESLLYDKHQIEVPYDIVSKAKKSLDRMLELK